jgi:hypothetical protein
MLLCWSNDLIPLCCAKAGQAECSRGDKLGYGVIANNMQEWSLQEAALLLLSMA